MKFWMFGFVACACTGCTMMSLERHSVAQTDSAIDLRYREIMDNLAMIANDPSTLPSYSSIYAGTAFVQDQGELISTTVTPWLAKAGSQAVNPQLNRQIGLNWALDPIVIPERLEAMRAACQWVIGGPNHVHKDSMSLLIRPEEAEAGPDRHFGVYDKLAQLPPGWLYMGRKRNVPACARYKAHCGETWVWVTPDGMKGLTDFALIIQHLARAPINSEILFHFPASYTPVMFRTSDPANARFQTVAQVVVNPSGHLVTESPWYAFRIENAGVDSTFRSQLGAIGAASLPR